MIQVDSFILDSINPINRSISILRGLQVVWQVVSPLDGSIRLYDLLGFKTVT